MTLYSYSDTGDLQTVTGPGAAVWTYSYDLDGRQTSVTDPDTGTTINTYTDLDQLATATDARGNELQYKYDSLGRMTDEWAGPQQQDQYLQAHWDYDGAAGGIGKLADATRYVGTSQGQGANGDAYTTSVGSYDALGKPNSTTLTLGAHDPLISSGAFPAAGLTVKNLYYAQTDALGTVQTPSIDGLPSQNSVINYDAVGLEAKLSGWVLEADYTNQGELGFLRLDGTTVQDPNQVDITNTYNDGTWTLGKTEVEDLEHAYDSEDNTYTYDPAGNLKEAADSSNLGGTGQTEYQCFTYDTYDQLNQAWTPGNATGGTHDCDTSGMTQSNIGGAAAYWNTYTYTPTGQRDTNTKHAAGGNTVTDYTYGQTCTGATTASIHALASTTVNGAAGGSLRVRRQRQHDQPARTPSPGPNPHLGRRRPPRHRPRGRRWTSPAWTTTNIYDADGNLLIRRTQTKDGSNNDVKSVLYDGGLEIHLDQDGSTNTITASQQFDFDGQPVGVESFTTGDHQVSQSFLVGDPHGTNTLAFDRLNGLAITKRWFGPFGNPVGPQPPAWPDDKRFLDKTFDTLSGLTQIGDRYYDVGTGAFISVDPVLNTTDPLSLNGYAYADNNPLLNSDPTGDMSDGSEPGGSQYDAEHGYAPQPSRIGMTGSDQDTTDLNAGRWTLPKGPTPAEIAGDEWFVHYEYMLYKQREAQAEASKPFYERAWDDATHVFSSVGSMGQRPQSHDRRRHRCRTRLHRLRSPHRRRRQRRLRRRRRGDLRRRRHSCRRDRSRQRRRRRRRNRR